MKLSRDHLLFILVGAVLLIAFGSLGGNYVYQQGFNAGHDNGYISGVNTGYIRGQTDMLTSIQGILKAGAIVMNWTSTGNGNYNIEILRAEGNSIMNEYATVDADTFNVLNMSGLIGDNHVSPKFSVNIGWMFDIAEGVGVKEISGSSGNLITDIGTQYVSNLTCGRAMATPATWTYTLNGTNYIALGNGTNLAYADTKLTQEFASSDTGFKRSAQITPTFATGTGIGNGYYFNFTLVQKFTATQSDNLNCTSLQWSGVPVSDGNMFNEATIGTTPASGQTFQINDNATLQICITVQK